MLPIIDIVHTAINAGKDLSSLNIGNKGLSSLNRVLMLRKANFFA
jgi:hypothetical protein